jgi:hypothetical protein
VVPTALWTNASGKRAASWWTAFQPVQCAGMMRDGESSSNAWTVGPMIASNIGPLRWKPPITTAIFSCPVKPLRIADGVHDPGVAAAAEDDEAEFGQPKHHRLVVEDQRVGLPAASTECLVPAEARLELRRSIDLTCDQHRAIEQEGGSTFLEDVKVGSL